MDSQSIARTAGGALLGASLMLLPAAAAAASPLARKAPTTTAAARPAPPNLRGTVALPAKLSSFAEGWERARRAATGNPRLAPLIDPARSLPWAQQLAFVQAAVHRSVRWISDATEYGRRDYWASTAETLARGAGDMEDRAIVKMEALRNLGFAPGDLFLTVGTDRVAGPVTVLVVRTSGGYVMLDDTGGPPFLADHRPDFEPMLTFGYGGSWLHGRRRLPQQIAAKATPGVRSSIRPVTETARR